MIKLLPYIRLYNRQSLVESVSLELSETVYILIINCSDISSVAGSSFRYSSSIFFLHRAANYYLLTELHFPSAIFITLSTEKLTFIAAAKSFTSAHISSIRFFSYSVSRFHLYKCVYNKNDFMTLTTDHFPPT